jgi:NADH-quinone oxidoreductase subunit M
MHAPPHSPHVTTPPFSSIFDLPYLILPRRLRSPLVLEHSTILSWMMLVPLIGGLLILAIPAAHAKIARFVALLFCLETFILSLVACSRFDWSRLSYAAGGMGSSVQLLSRYNWIRPLGIQYFIGVDGLSLPLVLLATALILLACWASYGIAKSTRGYYALLLFLLTATIGVFVSLDLVLFTVFFEAALVPIHLLIGIWGTGGSPRKENAAIKMFLFALVGSLGLLLVIVGLYSHTKGMGPSGGGVFDLVRLATDPALRSQFAYGGAAFSFGQTAFWLLLAAFALRLPTLPVHTWLADAHTEATTPVSMLLAGIIVPMGAYGILRIAQPLFPEQAADAWFYVALLAVATILYGALMALAQKDLKRLISCISLAGMGYVLLGLAVMTPIGFAGALFQLVAVSISSAMMFFIAGILFDRAHHREIKRLGGLWSQMPAFAGWAIVGFLAMMGLPGLCGFIGQLLVLLGVFSAADSGSFLMRHTSGTAFTALLWFGVLAAAALLLIAAGLLWTFQRIFMGAPKPEHHHFASLTRSEKWILAILGLTAITLGVLPMLLLNPLRPAIDGLMRLITG